MKKKEKIFQEDGFPPFSVADLNFLSQIGENIEKEHDLFLNPDNNNNDSNNKKNPAVMQG